MYLQVFNMTDRPVIDNAKWGESFIVTALAGKANHEFIAVVAPSLHPSLCSIWNTTIDDNYTERTVAGAIGQLGMTMGG